MQLQCSAASFEQAMLCKLPSPWWSRFSYLRRGSQAKRSPGNLGISDPLREVHNSSASYSARCSSQSAPQPACNHSHGHNLGQASSLKETSRVRQATARAFSSAESAEELPEPTSSRGLNSDKARFVAGNRRQQRQDKIPCRSRVPFPSVHRPCCFLDYST